MTNAVLVGPHSPPRDYVEAFGGQGQQRPAILAEQTGLLLVLGVVGFLPSSRHLPGSRELKFPRFHTLGLGTNSLRRTMPTFASTAPFS